MEEQKIMKFKDEDGNVLEFEAVARIFLEEQEYLILAPLDAQGEEYVFRVDHEEDGQEVYNSLESDTEFLNVKKEYSRLLYDVRKGDADE